jgi:shikimate dehydrogenase
VDPGSPVIRLAVFGKPVSQSLSPRIHLDFARQFDLQMEYRALEATPESFPGQVLELRASGGRGCNVTVPLKHAAWMLADSCSDSATRARAANTLVFDDDLYADNTDGRGLVDDLSRQPGARIEGSRICLLGAGGAAAGILGALLRAQPALVVIANRTPGKARDLAERHSELGETACCALEDIATRGPFDLVVNATSQGHQGQAPALSRSWMKQEGLCYDLNYGPAAMPLRRICATEGIAYVDGLGMLVGQAALSFELWTGKLPDVEPVLAGLR